MGYEMLVDARERAVIECLRGQGAALDRLGGAELGATLAVGDVVFRDAESGDHVFCIERKRLDDCVSSVRDGRYEDQKARMVAAFGRDRVLYILEGAPEGLDDTGRRTVAGVQYNTLLRDGVAVVTSEGVADTCRRVLELWERLPRIVQFPRRTETGTPAPPPPSRALLKGSFRKGAGVTRADVFAAQLALVPGVSAATARRVAAEVDGFGALRDALRAGALDGLRVNGRRVGAKLAALLDYTAF